MMDANGSTESNVPAVLLNALLLVLRLLLLPWRASECYYEFKDLITALPPYISEVF